jgi:pilus assembly protein CpaB
MSLTRILVLVAAIAAAGVAALLVRNVMGTQAEAEASPRIELDEVLVASRDIEVGTRLTVSDVRWMEWPKAAVSSSFITKAAQPTAVEEVALSAVARSPLTPGQPITEQNVVRADSGGFMAATLSAGKRAYGIELNAERGAGGFILPNDRVDVLMTRKLGQDSSGESNYQAITVLRNVRVLAVDQTSDDESDSKAIVAKTATLEVSEREAETLALADAMGDLSLTLRSLARADDQSGTDDEKNALNQGAAAGVTVVRYGIKGMSTATPSE